MEKENKDKGDYAEKYFIRVVKDNHPTAVITKATRDEDMKQHWDYRINDMTFDVKAEKGTHSRGMTSIEFTARSGLDGWVYGEANFIAFMSGASFICAIPEELVELCYKKVILKKRDNVSNTDALYHLINTPDKWGQQRDLIMLVTYQDILDLKSTKIIYKKNDILINDKLN